MKTLPPKTSSPRPRRRRASALMIMIWAVMLMSVTVMGVVEYVSYSADEATQSTAEFRALYLAESGLTVGLHPDTRRGDPHLKQKIGTDSGFDVVINYEGARIPVNYLVDERLGEVVYNLFIYWGLSAEQASITVDSLADWMDRDEDPRPNGAEAAYYESLGISDRPRQRGFIKVDEMLLVRGMGAVDQIKPDWREYFSVYGDGLIDLRTAFRDVLIAVTKSSEADVDRYLRERDGADGLAGTEDDRRIRSSEAYNLLALDSSRAQALSSILVDSDDLRRITSTGYVGEKRAQIVVVARRGDDRSLTYVARIEE
ncbi:MAG: general secretion pathway protein GspK [Verrucomicrobiales bacterium]|nr:general secretion pathway protein GspK [Verrucomicrobiales bacterium]